MDFGNPNAGPESPFDDNGGRTKKPLPADLPTSLDDRRMVREHVAETEMYDGWQGPSPQSLTLPARLPCTFDG